MILNKLKFCIFLFFILYQTTAASKTSTEKDFNPRYLSNYLSAIISYNNQNNENSVKYIKENAEGLSKNHMSEQTQDIIVKLNNLKSFKDTLNTAQTILDSDAYKI